MHIGLTGNRRFWCAAIALAWWLAMPRPARADTAPASEAEAAANEDLVDAEIADEGELFDLSIEELLQIPVALAGRREQEILAVPAAAYVITPEEIESSGLTTLPELLRLAPGVTVGRIDANKWAVSIRGFTSRFASKLLVLMDGRTLYTPLFSGTYWDVQDTFFPDIEGIEVIRGPGGSLWGTNAVNGIINIVTKDAEDTQGLRAYAAAGYGDVQAMAGARYGGRVGDVFYRVYGKYDWFDSGEVLGPDESENDGLFEIGSQAQDGWQRGRVGARADIPLSGDGRAMIQGNAYVGRFGQTRLLTPDPGGPVIAQEDDVDARGAYVNTRLRRPVGGGGELVAQAFYDYTFREDGALSESRHTADIDVQFQQDLGGLVADLVTAGASYRITTDQIESFSVFTLDPASYTLNIAGAFAQVETSALDDTLHVVVGTKVEHNDFTGVELQPSARALVQPVPWLASWAAVTRAVRVPSRADEHAAIALPDGTVIPIGNPDVDSELLWAYEVGTRWLQGDNASVDLAAFYQDYTNLIPFEVTTNDAAANIYGGEAAVTWQVIEPLLMRLHYAYARGEATDPSNDPAENDDVVFARLPRHQANLRAVLRLDTAWELDLSGYYASQSQGINEVSIDNYLKLDARIRWMPIDTLFVELVGQNLVNDVRAESREALRLNTGIERSGYLRLNVTY